MVKKVAINSVGRPPIALSSLGTEVGLDRVERRMQAKDAQDHNYKTDAHQAKVHEQTAKQGLGLTKPDLHSGAI